jgi:hypothetical protein
VCERVSSVRERECARERCSERERDMIVCPDPSIRQCVCVGERDWQSQSESDRRVWGGERPMEREHARREGERQESTNTS